MSVRHLLVLGVLLAAWGAVRPADTPDADRGGGGPPEGRGGGLTGQERKDFYHLAEGSEIFPAEWLAALESVKPGKPFLDDLERFGLIPDAAGPVIDDGTRKWPLPVGLTLATPRGSSLRMVGVNCAACHVGEITYRGNRPIRVDGGQALFDAEGFYQEAFASVGATLQDRARLIAFLERLQKNPHKNAFSRLLEVLLAKLKAASGDTAGLENVIVERLRQLAGPDAGRLQAGEAEDYFQLLAAPGAGNTRELARGLLERQKAAAERRGQALGNLLGQLEGKVEAQGDLARELARLGPEKLALLEARFVFLRRLQSLHAPGRPQYPPGPGRVDAFVTARNLLFQEKESLAPSSPVSYPHIWVLNPRFWDAHDSRRHWLHWDANTNSVMERNIGQSLGLGAVATRQGQSTVLPQDLHRLELLVRKLEPPRWPDAFGAVDRQSERYQQGKRLYEQNCASCHDRHEGEDKRFEGFGVYRLQDVGTDPERANNFATPLRDGTRTEFARALAQTLRVIKKQAYKDNHIPPEQWGKYDLPDNQIRWVTTGGYVARPLRGVWATAPYLHNGSVPTLDDLLKPEDQRPVVFPVGHREYDPVKVGYVSSFEAVPAGQRPRMSLFDTRVRGNSNRGHSGKKYGTELKDEERRALLEYLKVVGE